MAAVSYTTLEVLVCLLLFAILFGAFLLVLMAGILLDEGLRSLDSWLKIGAQGRSARKRSTLRPAVADRRVGPNIGVSIHRWFI